MSRSDDNTRWIRYHSSDDMDRLGELAGRVEACAVVVRPGGSLDVYGYVGIVDQRPESGECSICVPVQCPGKDCPGRYDDSSATEAERIASALHFARTYGQIQGDHHRAWVIEQITAALEGRPADGTRGIAP